MNHLLIDGDGIAYSICSGVEQEIRWEENLHTLHSRLEDCIDIFNKYLNIDFNGFPVREIQLNEYQVGGFIPPHKDVQHSIHSVIVPLQDEPQNRLVFGDEQCYYDNVPVEESDKQNRTQSFPDIKGVGYNFDGIQPVHWVPPVVSKRYSATFLYSI